MTLDRATVGWAGIPLLVVGLALAVAAGVWLSWVEFRRTDRREVDASAAAGGLEGVWRWCLIAALVAGTLVRVVGLGERGLSHPEAYIPGLNLPAGMSLPPPRHGFVETAVWHFRAEPHPFGYYLAMWAWTKTVGATLVTIRLPEAILGVLSIWLIYRVGRLAYSVPVGVVAAGLLSLHGFHTYWSQVARMYAPGAFLGLLSTWLLLTMTRGRRSRPLVEIAYVATTVAGAMTVEAFWPFLCAQILWTALNHTDEETPIPRAAVLQAAAFMMAAPMLSHAAMLGRNGATPPPSLAFLRDYLSFGFLFQHGAFEEPTPTFSEPPFAGAVIVLAASVVLLAAGLRATSADEVTTKAPPPRLPLALCAVGMCLAMLGLAIVSYVRHTALAALSLVPLVAVLIPLVAGRVRPWLARAAPVVERLLRDQPALTSLVPTLALLPALAMFVVSYVLTLTAPRAFLIFVPYLLIVVAAGAVSVARRRVVSLTVGALLVSMFAASTVILHRTPISPRDYQGLGRQIQARLQPDDLIFVPGGHWGYTPLFFYLDHDRLVPGGYFAALRRHPNSRVWLPTFFKLPTHEDATRALEGYKAIDHVDALEAQATLYVPPSRSHSPMP